MSKSNRYDMTIKEWVETHGKSEYSIYSDFYDFINSQTARSPNANTSWYSLELAVRAGDAEKINKVKSVLDAEYTKAKKALKLFNAYKGEKKTGNLWQSKHVKFEDGVLFLSENITPASLLKMSRLLRDANARCAKHPSNANVGLL